jgi:hypothetical protein
VLTKVNIKKWSEVKDEMKEKLITVSQMGELLNVKSQGLYAQIKAGSIIRREDGFIDILDPQNAGYLKEKGISAKSVKVPEEGRPGRPVVPRPAGKISPSRKSRSELSDENLILKNEKLQLEVARKRKELLPVADVEDIYFSYLEKLNSNIERLAGTYLRDIGKDILSKGEGLPEHTEKFLTHVLSLIHNTKAEVLKKFNAYIPE